MPWMNRWMQRLIALMLCLTLLPVGGIFALAEDESLLMSDFADDGDAEDDADVGQTGSVPVPPPVSIATGDGKALYNAQIVIDCYMREKPDENSKRIKGVLEGTTVEILDVDVDWVYVRLDGTLGWMKRLWIAGRPAALDPENTPPYGVYQYNYTAVVEKETYVRLAPGEGGKIKVTLGPGTKVAIMDIYEGWGRFFYNHTYGYIHMADLKDLTPVSPTDVPISQETPIATYTTYYNVANTESNRGRMKNIANACQKLSKVYKPGESLNFNKDIGPYTKANGYHLAPVLVKGQSMPGYGGGTCQVSSTLFNVLLQLPGITVLQRRPHGQSGAKYLPIGMDAAVGNDSLNLRWRNDYDFPIRLEAVCQDGALTMTMWKVAE